ncbi:MAG: DUF4924 family protein [Muribaculaceae bacterium]|nr:DUF4924 family protein [Muribaculaceae bacterium]
MIIASEKRRNNIAEYLLYMWQIEDLIRANGLDMERIRVNVIDRFDGLSSEQKRQMEEWYESLIDMMRREGVVESGHLQMNNNVLQSLVELHRALMADPRFADYSAEFYRTLPFIVELRATAGDKAADELTTCFTALYGTLMLRLAGKEISPDTLAALGQISRFIATLSALFHKNETKPLFAPED